MAWDQKNNQGPWGDKSGGNNWQHKSSGPTNFEDLIRKAQIHFRNKMPKGFQSFAGIGVIAAIAVVIWVTSGFYIPREGEQAVILRFGKYVRTTGPGLSWHFPYPIEDSIIQRVSEVHQIDSEASSPIKIDLGTLRKSEDQPLMLTGDENIADVRYTVQWFIKDLPEYLFRARDPETTVQMAAESVIREIIGQTPIAEALTTGRGNINQKAQENLQKLVDEYQLGIQIKEVSLQRVDPPGSVIDAFRNVQKAKAIKEQKINEAEAYRNSVVPTAQGDAIKIIQNAEAYKSAKVALATGEAGRFLSVLTEYRKAPQTTLTRLRLETKQKILSSSPKIFFDGGTEGIQNVLPHLALPAIQKPAPQPKEGETQQ